MTQNAKPLGAGDIDTLRLFYAQPMFPAHRQHISRDIRDLIATIDQHAAEIERLRSGADWLSRLAAGYIEYGGENAPLAYFNDTGFPGELANILAEAREAHEATKEPK